MRGLRYNLAIIIKREQEYNERISAEMSRLNEIFKDLSEDKKKVALRLMERVAFMTITLVNLEKEVKNKVLFIILKTEAKLYALNIWLKKVTTL